jgi:hypothetical protein
MKRFLLIVPLATLALVFGPVAQGGGNPVVRTVFHYDGTGADINRCTGEPMSPVGDIVLTFHEVSDANGGTHVLAQSVFDITLTGLVTGDVYRLVGASHATLDVTPGASVRVVSGMFQTVGPGPGNNFALIIVELTITNANGELVVWPGPGAVRFGCS